MTSLTSNMETGTGEIVGQPLNCHMAVDIPSWEELWPLRSSTSGTQTSPRAPKTLPCRKMSLDSVGELSLPGLEPVTDPALGSSEPVAGPPLSQTRQFSTETQTELDILFSTDWEECVGTAGTGSELPDVEKLLTTEMETQTHEGEDNLLLFANNCTQTAGDDFLSALLLAG